MGYVHLLEGEPQTIPAGQNLVLESSFRVCENNVP